MTLCQDLLGRRCRPLAEPGQEFHYCVAATWCYNETLWVAVISDGGGANRYRFADLQFEPSALKGFVHR